MWASSKGTTSVPAGAMSTAARIRPRLYDPASKATGHAEKRERGAASGSHLPSLHFHADMLSLSIRPVERQLARWQFRWVETAGGVLRWPHIHVPGVQPSLARRMDDGFL